MRRRAALLTVLAGTALAVPAAPAAAAACSGSAGVTVVVDFASLGGGTQTGCASGDSSSGVAALRATGHTSTRAAQEPGYFLCRIDGKPANDPCQRTSPANAYWSYWHAKPGGAWTYSDAGPADYDPAPGTVEGWAFGAGKPPSSPPPRPSSPSPSPTPAPTRTTAAAATPSAARHLTTTSRSPAASPVVASRSPSSTPTPIATTRPSPDAVYGGPSDDGDIRVTSRAYAIPWSVLVAGLVVALLLAAAARQVVVRRRQDRY